MKRKLDEEIIRATLENPKLLESLPDEMIFFDNSNSNWTHLFTPKRMEILNTIREKNPRSVSELAKLTHRDVVNVYRDLKHLEKFSLIRMEKHGRNTEPKVLRSAAVILFN